LPVHHPNQSAGNVSANVHSADNQGDDVEGDPAERRKPRRTQGGGGGAPPRGRRRRGPSGRMNSGVGGGGGSPSNNQGGGQLPPYNNNNNEPPLPPNEGDGPRRPPRNRRRQRNNPTYANDRPPQERILSKTAVFVANLPFSVDDAELGKIFENFRVKSAHVVRTRTQRSRGYGFVEFETEAEQLEAINTKNSANVNGTNGDRQISVTASHSVPPPPKEVVVGANPT